MCTGSRTRSCTKEGRFREADKGHRYSRQRPANDSVEARGFLRLALASGVQSLVHMEWRVKEAAAAFELAAAAVPEEITLVVRLPSLWGGHPRYLVVPSALPFAQLGAHLESELGVDSGLFEWQVTPDLPSSSGSLSHGWPFRAVENISRRATVVEATPLSVRGAADPNSRSDARCEALPSITHFIPCAHRLRPEVGADAFNFGVPFGRGREQAAHELGRGEAICDDKAGHQAFFQ